MKDCDVFLITRNLFFVFCDFNLMSESFTRYTWLKFATLFLTPTLFSSGFITTLYQTLRYAEVFITFVLNNVFWAIKKEARILLLQKKHC